MRFFFFFFKDTAPTEIYTLSLHDALPICQVLDMYGPDVSKPGTFAASCLLARRLVRSEEHTSELQSLRHLVCRLLLEKKKNEIRTRSHRLTAGMVLRLCVSGVGDSFFSSV